MVSRKKFLLYITTFITAHSILYLFFQRYHNDFEYSRNLNFVIKVHKIRDFHNGEFIGNDGGDSSISTTTTTSTTHDSTTATTTTHRTTTEKATVEATTTATEPKTTKKGPSCPYPVIYEKTMLPSSEQVTCKPNQLSESACSYVTKEFPYNFDKHKCGNSADGGETVKICEFQELDMNFKCDYKACGKDFDDPIYIFTFRDEVGWYKMETPGYNDSESLEGAVLRFAKQSRWSQDLMFLSCNNDSMKTQLLHFDSGYFEETDVSTQEKQQENKDSETEEKDGEKKKKKKLNINVVWLDSLSRRHFYRSLPKTVQTMDRINRDTRTKAEILDFELMQSVHGHTHENLIAFTQGKVK